MHLIGEKGGGRKKEVSAPRQTTASLRADRKSCIFLLISRETVVTGPRGDNIRQVPFCSFLLPILDWMCIARLPSCFARRRLSVRDDFEI